MDIRFDNKTVLITGGSAGIGYACAEVFGAAGAKLAICGTNPSKLENAANALREKGYTVFAETCDVSVIAEQERFAAHVQEALGPIDVWIANAGVMPAHAIIDTEEAVWDKTFDTNLKSIYAGSRIVYRAMKERGGVMLVALSFAAIFPSVGSGVYAATKAAATSMVKTLAAELAPYHIRVNGYIPGVVTTEMNRERIARDGESLLAAIAMREFTEPEDVAWACAFLASDYARNITGTAIEISGGKMGVQNPMRAWEDKETREKK